MHNSLIIIHIVKKAPIAYASLTKLARYYVHLSCVQVFSTFLFILEKNIVSRLIACV